MLLSVENLTSRFFLPTGVVHAVEQVSFDLRQGESLGIVGESGSGKTATVMSLLRLLPAPGRIVGGSVRFEGRELLELEEEEIRRIRGVRMALIPQNPGSALNRVLTIGWQLREALETHQDLSRLGGRGAHRGGACISPGSRSPRASSSDIHTSSRAA